VKAKCVDNRKGRLSGMHSPATMDEAENDTDPE